jgi:hypothetical protein
MLLNIASLFPPKRNVNQNEMKIKSLNYFFSPSSFTLSANTWGVGRLLFEKF